MGPALATDIIGTVIGDWGRWQRRTTLLIFLCKIPSAWFMACIIYTAPFAQPGEYFCKQTDQFVVEKQKNLLNAIHSTGDNLQPITDYCNVYQNNEKWITNWQHLNGTTILNSSNFDNPFHDASNENIRQPCTEFEHKSIYDSLVTQFDLVCSRTILIAVTQFYHLFGVLTGGILATSLLNYFSPRKVMLFGMITQICCGCLTGLVNSFNLHSFFRYLSAVCCAQMYTAGQMIFLDITGGIYRKSANCLFETFWGIGVILLPLIAHYFSSWTSIYLVISLPTAIYIILWNWIPDSPRWLIKHGKIDDVKEILLNAAKLNHRMNFVPNNLDYYLNDQWAASENEPTSLGWWSLWKSKKSTVTMLALHTAWAVYVTNYNGMLLNIRAFGRNYIDANTIAAGMSEIVGVLIAWFFVIKTNKYKWFWTGVFNIITGILTCTGFLFPSTLSEPIYVTLAMALALISKAATTCSQTILVACTSELVPTLKRNICIFSCIVWARIWLLTAPFIGVLTFMHNLLPLAAFGLLGLIGGICTCIIHRQQNPTKINAALNIKPFDKSTSCQTDIFVISKSSF